MSQPVGPENLDLNARYAVSGQAGVAWYIVGYVMIRDEDYEWSGMEYQDRDNVRMCMVGDDQVHIIAIEDLIKLNREDYCSECGQIGCKGDAYDG